MNIRQLIDKHYRSGELYSMAYCMTYNHHEAEDLLHVTIERMIEKESYYKNKSFFGFVKTVMFRMYSNEIRRYKTSGRKHLIYAKRLERFQDVEKEIHYKQVVNDSFKILDDKYSRILNFKLNEYTSAEIAEVTGIDRNTVNGQFYQVRQRIKKRFKDV